MTVTLDHDQLMAARSDPRRPLLVLAGPGSGKTYALVERIAFLLSHDHADSNPSRPIVALTFTRNAARELEARLKRHLGDDPRERIDVRTFHSFGLLLLRTGWARSYLGWEQVRVATTEQMRQATTVALADLGLVWTVEDALRAIGDEKLGRRRRRECQEWTHAARRGYDAWLHRRCLIDVHDMLVLPVDILRTQPEARRDLQRRVAHVVGDESQDWTPFQAALIAYAGGADGRITAVGDATQSIYSGSSPRYLCEFPLAFKNTAVVSLTRTYRLHAAQLAVATAVAAHIVGATAPGVPDRADGPRPTLHIAPSAAAEGAWLARELRHLRATNTLRQWADAVVLVRTRLQRQRIIGALTVAGIPCRTHTPSLAEAPVVTAIMAWLTLLCDSDDNIAVLHAISTISIERGDEGPCSLRSVLRASGPWTMERLRHECPPGLEDRQKRDLARFVRLYDGLVALMAGNEPVVAFDAVLERTGLGARCDHTHTEIAALRALVAQEGDVGAVQHLLAEERIEDNRDVVLVDTVHSFKGNEADVVFLAGLDDDIFPHRVCLRDGTEGVQQELRAFYVALTRPRALLYLSASCEPVAPATQGRPSRFLELIPPDLLHCA